MPNKIAKSTNQKKRKEQKHIKKKNANFRNLLKKAKETAQIFLQIIVKKRSEKTSIFIILTKIAKRHNCRYNI